MFPRPGQHPVSFPCRSNASREGLYHDLQKDIKRIAFMVTFLV